MNEDRFRKLADAYGGDVRRWPLAVRGEASAFASSYPAHTDKLLRSARRLDEALDTFSVEPSAALRQTAIDLAPRGRSAARTWRWITTIGLGLGLAASAAAGVAAGVTLAPAGVTHLMGGPPTAQADDSSGLFSDPTGELVDS
jgi:hypothetical protein